MNPSLVVKQWQASLRWYLSVRRWKTYKWLFFPFLGLCLAAGGAVSRQISPVAIATPTNAWSELPNIYQTPSDVIAPPDLAALADTTPSNAESPQAATTTPTEQTTVPQAALPDLQANMASVDAFIEMRVAIAEAVSSLSVGTSDQADVMDESGQVLYSLAPGEMYSVQPSGQGLIVGSTELPAVVLINPDPNSLFYLGDRAYRGRLLLIADGGQLWAVNFVNMQTYLYSVVGSEVSASWNVEALKAQAVAARSYALTYYFRPINSIYHLGATEYYQVYKGISAEDDRIKRAVDATAGQFVSYQGGIVESLYAASDDIVMDAFQGAGMSQLGALDLANQGVGYTQILTNYYPGTNLGQLVLDQR